MADTKTKSDFWPSLGMVLWWTLICVCWLATGYCKARDNYHKEAIDRGVAAYNARTGVWEWTVEKTAPEQEDE